jgi:hypothetical protein
VAAAEKLRDHVEIVWTTYEDSFLRAFGPRLHTVVTQLEERGIAGHHSEVWAASRVGAPR